MPESLDMHEPLLINSIGHSAGLLLFAGFLILVLRDQRRGAARPILPALAAALALLWNAGSLIVLAGSSGLLPSSDFAVAASFAVLSLLPAVLLQLSLDSKARWIWIIGYAVSAAAVGLHLAELIWSDTRLHQTALWVIVCGFGVLTVIAMFVTGRLAGQPLSRRRIPVSMCLFLLAISFVHFSPGHVRYAWSSEIALHHAGIPLALYVLLQDYRFLLLDAFLRFVANSVVASGFIVLSVVLNSRFRILEQAAENPFLQGTLLVGACLALVLVAFVRGRLQLLLTRVVFHRTDGEPAVAAIREAGGKARSESDFLERSVRIVAAFAGATRGEVRMLDPGLSREPFPISGSSEDWPHALDNAWAEAGVPLRFAKGDGALLLLGRREGGRRYLSEDLRELGKLAEVIVEQVERFRSSEIQRLVSQAELRALQSQINPHFLFNSLNTLYGTIPREAAEARRLVLNLAEIFRYFLQSDRALIPLAEELEIVQAYLQIERLRLGEKLRTEIDVDKLAERALIPILSVQPLVENAVKHGIASRSGPGFVRLAARVTADGVTIEVSDDGRGFETPASEAGGGCGVGLDNVRQRLRLCYGDPAFLKIDSSPQGSTVSFLIPGKQAFRGALEEVSA